MKTRYLAFLFVILASVGFFNYRGLLDDQMLKLVFYFAIMVSGCVALVKGKSLHKVDYPRIPYFGIILMIFVSMVMATALHPQPITVSVITTLPFVCAFSFFYILLKLDVPRQKIIKTYYVLFAVSTVVYICNVFTMPLNIFGLPIINEDFTRGIVRIPVVFIEMAPLLVFYAINQWLLDHKRKWIVVIAWVLIMIFVSVVRQIIALTCVLSILFLLRSMSWFKKILLSLAVVSVVYFVLPQIPIYQTMIELSEDQRDNNEDDEDVRVKAWRFYTYENQTGETTALFGNGVPAFGNSVWGNMMYSECDESGLFAADVSWAGFFWYFGGIATALLLILLLKAASRKQPPHRQYLSYWFAFLIFTSIASGTLIYYWQIIDIMVCLYLVYKPGEENEGKPDVSGNEPVVAEERRLFKPLPQISNNIKSHIARK